MSDPPTMRALVSQRTVTLTFTVADVEAILEDLDSRLGHGVHEATRDLYRRLRQARTTPPQGEPVTTDDDIIYAPPQPVRRIPDRQPSRGTAIRKVDVTNISGLGHIVEFCVFSDGATAIRWLGGPPQNQPKWEFYDNPGIEPFVQISGHGGNTEIVWIDEPAPQQ